MASTDAKAIPVKNTALRITFPILDADGDLVTGASSLDSEVSKDGGTFADCTNEATEIATASGMYYLDLTSTEMNADTVAIIVKSGNGKTTPIVLYTADRSINDLATAAALATVDGIVDDILVDTGTTLDGKLNTIDGIVDDILVDTSTTLQAELDGIQADTEDIQARLPAALVGGRIDATLDATGLESGALALINAEVDTALADYDGPTNTEMVARTLAAADYATATALQTVDDEIAVIDGIVDSILVDTAELGDSVGATLSADIAAVKADTAAILTDTGTTLDGKIDAILTDTAEIGAAGAGLTALASAANLATVDTVVDGIKAVTDKLSGLALTNGTIGSTGNSTTALHLDGLTYGDDEINGHFLAILDVSTGETHVREITDWVLSTELATVATLPFTPQNATDTYWILSNTAVAAGSAPTAAEIADAVWDEAQADHVAVGSFGIVASEVADILVDTSTTLQGELDGIQADTEDIQTRLPAALVGGRIDATVDATGLEAGALALINAEVDTALADYDPPTNTELTARTLASADYATASALATVDNEVGAIDTVVDAIKVTTDKVDDTLEDDAGTFRFTANALEEAPTGGSAPTASEIADAVWDEDLTAHTTPDSAGEILGNVATGTPPTAEAIADAVWDEATAGHTTSGTFGEQVKTDVDAILADTAELQGDWVNGGRLDSILDARASQTSVDDLPTNAELATSQAAADDATLAAIAALNNLSAAQVNAEVDTALADVGVTTTITGRIDAAVSTRATPAQVATELATYDGPTHAELTAGLAAADDAVLAAIAALNNLSSAQAQTAAAAALTAYDPPTHAELTAGLAAADDAVLSAIAALNNLSSAQLASAIAAGDDATLAALALVATDVDAVLALLDDARTEPGTGAPPVNPDLATKIDYLYKAWRNKKTQTAAEFVLFADDGTTEDQAATVSDDGTTTTVGEMGAP
jgi:hypothetical protein